MLSRVCPRCTVTPVGGTSAKRMVLFGSEKIASATSLPTFLASTSKAATISTSDTWYGPSCACMRRGCQRPRSRDGPCSYRALLSAKRSGLAAPRSLSHRIGLASLRRDEAIQPGDILLGGLAAVLHQRERVRVEALTGSRERCGDGREPFLEVGAPALQQADPGIGRQVLEEREADPEPVVLGGGLGACLLQQSLEELLAFLGDAVDVLAAADLLRVEDTLHGAVVLQAPQRGIQRAIGNPPEPSERVGQPLGELVAVHGPLFQQAQDRELEHPVPSLGCASIYRLSISNRYIEPRGGPVRQIRDCEKVRLGMAGGGSRLRWEGASVRGRGGGRPRASGGTLDIGRTPAQTGRS